MGRQVKRSKRMKKEKAKQAAKRQKGESTVRWQRALDSAIGICKWDDADGGELVGALIQLPEAAAMLTHQGGGDIDIERVVDALQRCHAHTELEV